MNDPRPLVLSSIAHKRVTAEVVVEQGGLVCGIDTAAAVAADLGLHVTHRAPDGGRVEPGETVLRVCGVPFGIALAEERLMGIMAKPSGIATAADEFVQQSAGKLQIVSGAWKKLPFAHKDMIRSAIVAGGAQPRIAQWPFAYLDKNFVAMLGGVRATLAAVARNPSLDGHRRVIQITEPHEASIAAACGADIVFLDTGHMADIAPTSKALRDHQLRDRVALAFGGGICLDDIAMLRDSDVDIVDVGRAIVDAPLLDMSLRVVAHR